MQTNISNFRWQIKLIFLVVLVVGLFFSWHGGRNPAYEVHADLPPGFNHCNAEACVCRQESTCRAARCVWPGVYNSCERRFRDMVPSGMDPQGNNF
jgi:hypothetical protein